MPDTDPSARLPTKPEVTRATAVKKLTAEIKTELTLAKEAGMTMVKHAQRVGELLIELKGRLPHGQYLPHVELHFGLSKQSAAGYVRLFERRDEIDAGMPLRQALKAISTPREPRNINRSEETTVQLVVPYTEEEAESDQRRVLEARHDIPASDVAMVRGQVEQAIAAPVEPVTADPKVDELDGVISAVKHAVEAGHSRSSIIKLVAETLYQWPEDAPRRFRIVAAYDPPGDAQRAAEGQEEAIEPDLADLRRRVQDDLGDEALTSYAKRAGISPQTFKSFVEGGRVYGKTVAKLEAALSR